MRKDEYMEWEQEAPNLAALPRITPYRVPDTYFMELNEQLNRRLKLENLASSEKTGFTVPNEYFNELSSQLHSRMKLEEIQTKDSKNGFSTPEAYFETLQAKILAKTGDVKAPVKVRSLWNSSWLRYAAAACFIVITASGLYFNQEIKMQNQLQDAQVSNDMMLYNIDERVIIEHLQESQTASNSTASQAEMESYILDHYSANDLSANFQ